MLSLNSFMALGRSDLDAIQKIVELVIEEKVTQIVREETSHLPTKEEFYNKEDEFGD